MKFPVTLLSTAMDVFIPVKFCDCDHKRPLLSDKEMLKVWKKDKEIDEGGREPGENLEPSFC